MTVLSIRASEIDNWTSMEPRRAQELLPKLIWKLILASSKIIEDIHFPFEKAVQYAGYDGYLVTSDNNSFYPNGASVWEFGTDADIKSKFNSDYEKRSNNPNGIDTSATTYCFVTSRIWNHREGIAEFTTAKKKDGLWKNVRILDANSIELWLNQCPSVSAWFSGMLGKPYAGIMSLADYWNYIVNTTEPKLTEEFFCYGRKESVADATIKIINTECSQIVLSADSKLEGILTLTADLLNDTNIIKQQILERTVVALSSDCLNDACKNFTDAIIVPVFPNDTIFPITDNTLIYPTESNGPIDLLYKNSPKIKIEARRRKVFTAALEKLGFDTNEADRIASDVKCRFLPLFRRITNDIQFKIPIWASYNNLHLLIPSLLANAWEINFEGDKVALEILSGRKYDDYISSISEFTKGDNMPIFRLDHSFACVSVNELWDILAQHINDNFFENYKKCVSYVFAETDPTYDLPEDKWFVAGVYGKRSKFSERLKRGLILSMTKIVELDENDGFFRFSSSCTSECNNLVFEIYNRIKNINQWRTLAPYIADFVEATPEVVLNIIENNVTQDSDVFWSLFESSGNSLFGRSFYTHILWALEKLVWIKEYSVRAINLLVALDEKNFEYKISNCPMDSLLKIFCFWHHQGALSVEERDTILANILNKHHAVGRKMINKLLPNGMSMTTNLCEYRWKYIEYPNAQITNIQYRSSVKYIATKFVESIDSSYEDWETVICHFAVFYNVFCELKIDIIQSALVLSEANRIKLCEKMAFHISRERKFFDESDTDNINITNEMEKLYHALLPDSPLKYSHYFSSDFYGFRPIVFGTEEYDYNKEQDELKKLRIKALEKTLDKFGLDAVLELYQNAKEPRFLIDSLIDTEQFMDVDLSFIIKAHQAYPQFSEKLVNSIYYKKGLTFFSDRLNNVPDSDVKWIIVQFPIRPDVIELINCFPEKIQEEFWKSADTWGIMRDDITFGKECINTLLKYHRPYSAIIELYYSNCLDINLIIEVLQAALDYHPNTERNGVNLNSINGHSIEQMFENIYKDPAVDVIKVSQLEFAYINKFRMDFIPKCLVKYALSNPSVFIELISYCSKKDGGVNEEKPKEKEYLARSAYEALDRIKQLPGQVGNCVDVNNFNSWIKTVLELAKESKYVTACDVQLGRILSYSPIDEDGIWPHKCVRDFLENNTSEIISDHICLGIFNQRGVHNVTGGDEEERISAMYRENSQKLQLLYPKTAHIVKRISDNYKEESKLERERELKEYF